MKDLQDSDLVFSHELIDEPIFPVDSLAYVVSVVLKALHPDPGLVRYRLRQIPQSIRDLFGRSRPFELDVVIDIG